MKVHADFEVCRKLFSHFIAAAAVFLLKAWFNIQHKIQTTSRNTAGLLKVTADVIDSLFGVSHEKQSHRPWFCQIQQMDQMFWRSVTNVFMRQEYSDWTLTDLLNQSQASLVTKPRTLSLKVRDCLNKIIIIIISVGGNALQVRLLYLSN